MSAGMLKVEAVLKQLESIFRGSKCSSQEEADLLKHSYEILDFFKLSSNLGENLNEEDRKTLLNVAIKLHNKLRNMSSLVSAEIKAVLKASAVSEYLSLVDVKLNFSSSFSRSHGRAS